MLALNVFLILGALASSFAFRGSFTSFGTRKVAKLNALDKSVIATLEETKARYTRLTTVVSDESEAEAKKLKDLVETYDVYKKLEEMLSRLKVMYTSENAERRKEKQMKSIVEAVVSRAELEEVLKEKLGLPFNKQPVIPPEIMTIRETTEKINGLRDEIEKVSVKLPEGKSTGAQRFGALSPSRQL